MGVKRAAPWWLGWMLVGGLAALFAGERILGSVGAARALFSGAGALVVLACVAWRWTSWRAAGEEVRRAEGLLLVASAGCALALVGHLLSSEDGMRWLRIAFADEEAEDRYRTILQVLWPTVLAVSLLPVLGAQLALGAHRHARGDAARVEGVRVVETASGGLVVALAGAFLLVLGYIVSERDKSLDLSYFKTASPGASTEAMVSSLEEPLRVVLFFPSVNEVKDEALRYFRRLADVTGRVQIEEHDRLESPRVAEQYGVTEDGTVLFMRGNRSGLLTLGSDRGSARRTLRSLDREVQRVLFPLMRPRLVVYFTTGHGELNDPSSAGPFAGTALGGVNTLKDMLRLLNYEARDLGIAAGLGREVPDDASVVVLLGPRRTFLTEELAALERYLARGGSLLLALDPESDFRMEALEQRLGVRYVSVPLADDEQHLSQSGELSDRRLVITNRFSSHESVTSLSRAGAGVLFVNPGHLEAVEDSGAVTPLFVVRSLVSTFADLSGDYTFDEGTESRRTYNLAAAVEGVTPGDAAPSPAGPMRALVYASSAVFTDAVLVSLGLNAALVADGIRWLGREEAFSGETTSEEDVPIVHTEEEDVVWFYTTILGAPALLLAAGLTGVFRRRRRRTES